jgi:hypothetical protein
MLLNKVFDNVLDIPGVDGLCLFGLSGEVFLNRMPAFLSPDIFADALRRIAALYETMDENFLPCDDYLLRFSEKWILFRRTDQAVLLVLAAETANFASTRMVTNMALKHLTPAALAELVSTAATAPGSTVASRATTGSTATPFSMPPFPSVAATSEPVAGAPAPIVAGDTPKSVRMFRGRAY